MLLAEDAPSGGGGNPLLSFLPIILIVVAMYFLLIRPNTKRRREQMELQASLAEGDEVRTAGGLYGTVVATDAESVTIEAAPGVQLRFARGAIATVVNKTLTEEEESAEDPTEPDDDPRNRSDRD